MSKKDLIGIIGGMGPRAGVHLAQQMLVSAHKYYGAKDDSDYPDFVLTSLSLSADSFNEKGITDWDMVKRQLKGIVSKLNTQKVSTIAIACNTVHFFIDDIQSWTEASVINIIDATTSEILANNFKEVTLLTSSSSRYGLYDEALVKAGIKAKYLPLSQQPVIDSAILDVMSYSEHKNNAFKELLMSLQKEKTDAIVLGCTELPIILESSSLDIKKPIVSSTVALVKKLLETTMHQRNYPE